MEAGGSDAYSGLQRAGGDLILKHERQEPRQNA